MLIARQRDLDQRSRTFSRRDHLIDDSDRAGDLGPEEAEQRSALEAQHAELLRRQEHLIQQKLQVQKEQEQLDRYIQEQKEKLYKDGSGERPHYVESESRVERFLKLAKALYLCDQERTGKYLSDGFRPLSSTFYVGCSFLIRVATVLAIWVHLFKTLWADFLNTVLEEV